MSLTSALSFGVALGAVKSASWGVAITTLAAGEYSELLKLIPKDGTFLATLGIGAVVVSLAIGAFQWFVSIRDKAKGVPFAELVKGAVGVTPTIADPAKRARLDDLRRKFDDGVEKFRAAGKDLYSLPWYLLVGPAGSGKTEALRHCNVGFPPGLQDYLQGAGGTLNMHWWFTNHAVVLDTAGRMFMEAAGPEGEGGEWAEFLKLLKRSRPNQPVNGMFLVIGADSLIRDKSEEIESKAGRIAQQLDTIQRTLDVRFPVFVIITKCDLIAGFREFFDNVTDPNLQHQLLGWSNPDQLDAPLRVELVEEHMKTVKHKLTARRLALVGDSTRYAQGTGKRMDEVDELYALPENLEKVVPRLKRYLETIFAGGEWSPKPLFLRGIYFTSSMREGEALDNDLAKALGLTLDSLPGGKVWEKDRSFFLRDVFLAKAFREKGLVTRATNVQKQIANRRFAILGSVAAAAALVLGFTFYGQRELTRSIDAPRAFWNSIGVALGVVEPPTSDDSASAIPTQGIQATRGDTAIVRYEAPNWVYSGERADVQLPEAMVPRASLPQLTLQRSNQGVSVPLVFSPAATLAGAGGGFTSEQRAAHAAVLETTVLRPLVEGARQRLGENTPWDARATNALAELIRLETLRLNLAPAGGPRATLIDLKALFSFVMGTQATPDELRSWQDAIDATYAAGTSGSKLAWPPASLRVGEVAALRAVREGLEKFAASWPERARGDEFALGRLSLLADALASFRAEETRLQSLRGMPGPDAQPTELVQTNAEFETFLTEARARTEALGVAAGKADELLQSMKLDATEMSGGIDATKREALEQISAEYALLIAQLPLQPEGDTPVTEPAPAGEIRQLIALRRDSAEKSLDESAARVNTRLAPLLPLVAAGAGGEDMSYRVRLNAYQRGAKDLFERGADSAQGEWYGLADRFRELDARVDRARADIESIARGVSDVSARNATVAAATALARTARAASATEVLRSFLSKLPESAEGVSQAVESIAQSKGLKPIAKPTIPLLGLQGGEIPVSYAPQAAGVVLQGLARAEQEISSGGAVVDKALLSAEIRSRGRGLDEYARRYASIWAVGLVKEMSLSDSLNTWQTLGPAIATNAERLIDRGADLRALASAAVDAIDPLPASVKALPEIRAAGERLAATAMALSDERVLRARADAIKAITPLGSLDWRVARAALIASGSGEAMTEALATLASATPRTITDESLAIGLLRALRDQYETNAREAVKILVASERWPLSRNADQTKPLDQAALLRAVEAADLLAQGAPVPAGATGEIRDLLLALRGRSVVNDQQRERIERVRTVANALAAGLAQNQPIVVSIVPVWNRRDLEALPALSSLGVVSAGDVVEWFEQMEVVPAGLPALPRVTLRGMDAARAAELVRQLSLKSPGPGVTIRFYRNLGDPAPAGETTINGPWVAAAVALLPGARPTITAPITPTAPTAPTPTASGGTAWIAPLPVVESETKQTYHLWLNVTFSAPLPRAEDWPGSTNWPR